MKPLAQRALDNQKLMIESISSQDALKIRSIVGWKKSETGRFSSVMVGTPNSSMVS